MNERSIFAEALEKDSLAQRSNYLDQACAGDATLRKRIETLLASHVEAGSFLGQPAPDRMKKQFAIPAGEETKGPLPSSGADQSLGFLTPSDKPGSIGRLGCYEIQEVIGRGGMGIVLGAFDDKLHRVVAIKVMATLLASNEHARRRFVREGRSAAAIRDDHVIGIHGVDEANGLPFLVMEYIVGRSLAERIEADGPLPIADTLRIGSQIARGLAAAHAQGVVHRDIKPANILLENGVERVKITDFGLAHAVDDVRTTQPGVVVGTPEYMSPEQARGEKVDHRSDLFSLGCVLYAMCAGRPPFRAESTVAIIRRVCEDTPRSLTEINSEIPVWLVDVIDKLIAKDAAERFQSAGEVAELLEQYLAHVQQPAVNPEPAAIAKPRPMRPHVTTRPHRRWLTAAAAAMLLLCAGLSLAETTGVTNLAATVIRIVRGDGTLVVEVDDPNIQVLLDGEEVVITGAGPKEIRLRPGQHELHTVKDGKPFETKLVTITRDGREVVKVAREQPADSGMNTRRVWADAVDFEFSGAASPDGKYLSYVDWSTGDIAVRDLATEKNRRLTSKGWPEYPGTSVFSPNSQQVAFSCMKEGGGYELRLVGIDGSGLRVLYASPEKEISYMEAHDWSPDGKFILASFSTKEAKQLVLVAVLDGSVRVLKTFPNRNNRGKIYFSPDGHYVAYSAPPQKDSPRRDIFLLDTETTIETPLVVHPADDFVLGWAPDGKRLVFASDRTGSIGAWVMAVAAGKPQGPPELSKPEMGQFHELGLTQGGSFYFGLFSGQQNVYTATLDLDQGKLIAPPVEAMQRGEGSNWAPVWSPDGKYLACLSSHRGRPPLFYIRSAESKQVRELTPNLSGFNVHSLHWSPDGQALLGAGGNEEGEWGALRIDVQTGAVTTLVPGTGRVLLYPQWEGNAKAILYRCMDNEALRIHRFDLTSGSEKELYQTPNRSAKWWAVSPDGQQLAFSVGGALMVLPTSGGEPRELTKGAGFMGTIAWTPDSRHLVFQRLVLPGPSSLSPFEFWRVAAAGGEPQKLDVDLPQMGHLRIHPDGRQIVFTGKPRIASTGKLQPDKIEVWALENFLPPNTSK